MSLNDAVKNNIDDALFTPLSEKEARLFSPLTLAFLGDAVYSLLVRNMLTVSGNKPTGKLHKESIFFVNASFQAEAIKEILPNLTENELSVFKRGRNAHSAHSPKHQSEADYRYATGFESLFGYLYLSGQTQRLHEIFKLTTYNAYLKSTANMDIN